MSEKTLRRTCTITVLASLLAVTLADSLSADLRSAAAEYNAAKSKLRSTPAKERDKFVQKTLQPALDAIGELDDAASLKFLESELISAKGVHAAAVARAMFHNSDDRAIRAAVGAMGRKLADAKKAFIDFLGKTKRSLAPAAKELAAMMRSERDQDVRKRLPAVIAKIGTVEAARELIGSVQAPRAKRGPLHAKAQEFSTAVVNALRGTKSDEIKAYLAGPAFERATPARLEVLFQLVRALKLRDAREQVVAQLGSSSEDVVLAAVGALEVIGVGDATDAVAKLLSRRSKSIGMEIQVLDTLAASDDPGAVKIVMDAAREGGLQTRVIALGSLARQIKNVEALKVLLAALDDGAVEVRNAALRALGRFRAKGMIGDLIAYLAEEKEEKLRIDALKLLIGLTGQNMGLQTDDWRKWWEVAASTFELPKENKSGNTSVTAYDLKYFGLEVGSKRLAFLIDNSSSMLQEVPVKRRLEEDEDSPGAGRGGRTRVKKPPTKDEGEDEKKGGKKSGLKARKIDVLKHELIRVLKELSAGTSVNIISFDANYSPWKKTLQPLAGRGRAAAIKFVRELRNGQGTNVYDTLEYALKDRRVDTIFLLTDGMPSRGKYQDTPSILREIGKQNRIRGATIHCIAFGEESPLLKELAKANGGEYRFVDSY